MELIEFFFLLLLNIVGIYALFKLGQAVYWYIRDRMTKNEEL